MSIIDFRIALKFVGHKTRPPQHWMYILHHKMMHYIQVCGGIGLIYKTSVH